MKRSLLVVLLMALGAVLALGVRAFAQDGGDDGRYVVIGAILWDKELGRELHVYHGWYADAATPPPTPAPPTETPSATDTPEPAPPTLTPSATATPTSTPVPSAVLLPTATPDSGITPSPTSSAVKACLATTSAAINLRADHTTSATVLDNIDPSTRMEVLRFWVVEDVTNEWLQVRAQGRSGQTRTGWIFRGSSVFVGVDDTEELCWDVPTDGPGQVPTPAPTATPQTVTPVPTGPAPGECVYSHIYVMTIRSGPGTSYSRVGALPANTPAIVGHIYPDTASERWAYITHQGVTGWVAVRAGGVTYGALEGDCASVPRTPVSAAPMVGWTVTPGASRDALVLAGRELQAAGITPTATVTSDHETASVLHDNGWYVVVRLWTVWPGDCPDMSLPPETSARLRVEYLARQHAGARFDAAQLTNECGWPSASYLRDWLIASVGECDARGWVCLPTVFNTGAPELEWLPTLRPALKLMREHHHLLGYNAYPYDAGRMLCEDSDYTSYFTFRYRRFADHVPPGELPPIYLTEAARGDGGRPPALEDVVCFARAVSGEVVGICYWYVGIPLVPWQAAAWSQEQVLIAARALVAAL